MTLSKADVDHVARLARLDLSEQEEVELAAELSAILDYASQLQEVNLDEVEPMSHVSGQHTVFRKDEPHISLAPDVVLQNAPDAEDQQFKVPAIMEG